VREITSENLGDGLVRRFISYTSFDGAEIPAFHVYKAGETNPPVILAITGVGYGAREVVGHVKSYQHSYGLDLAKVGYYVVVPEVRGQGYLGPPPFQI